MLYELLTGTRPHRPERASRRALEYVEALPWMDRAIAASAGADAATNAGRLGMLAQRAQVLFRLGRRKEALSEATAAVESLQRLPAVGRTGPLSLARVLLGRMLIETGRPREAEASLTAALDELAPLGDAHPQRAEASCELGRARLLQGGGAGDWQRLEQCLPIYRTWGLAEREVVASLEGLLAARSSGAR